MTRPRVLQLRREIAKPWRRNGRRHRQRPSYERLRFRIVSPFEAGYVALVQSRNAPLAVRAQ
jgi:hypothetical protein